MFSRENRIPVLFGVGLLIFISIVVWAGVIFIRDIKPPDDNTALADGASTNPAMPAPDTADAVSAITDVQESAILDAPQTPEIEPPNYLEELGSMPVSQETPSSPVAVVVPLPNTLPPESPTPPYTVTSSMTKPPPTHEHRGTLIFVIDDAGNNLYELEPFLRFPGPLTIAVLPGLPYSAEAARQIRAAGKEVILHQPMEAIGGQNPGPGAIYVGMPPQEIQAMVERNLAEIGPVAGMNNHQGSKVTMDVTAMEIILTLCRNQGIYFLDSRTIADTVAPIVAAQMGIKIGERHVFLDNIQDKASMIQYVDVGLQKARQQGIAVMIGHTWSSELAGTLTELYPNLIKGGYSLSTLSQIMREY
jgi:polysaccharide deacetylase 2 family uncharacterized protein YibQ